MDSYQIVLANHHLPLRECLRRILKGKPDLEVIGEAEDGIELLSFLTSTKMVPHMVILDLALPNLKRDVIHKLKAVQPDVKVLALSMHKDKEYFGQAIINGAEGYLLKENVDKELLLAIEAIRRGGVYVPSLLPERVSN
jgi:DNA-binding NarL/FixJ family response regulator